MTTEPRPLCSWRGCHFIAAGSVVAEGETPEKPFVIRYFCAEHIDRHIERLRGGK